MLYYLWYWLGYYEEDKKVDKDIKYIKSQIIENDDDIFDRLMRELKEAVKKYYVE